MRRNYPKFNEVIDLLKSGWEIYTSRGSAPYGPIYYNLHSGKGDMRRIHPMTIEKLIRDKVITGRDVTHGKYKLIA